jgi:hypothetical protein
LKNEALRQGTWQKMPARIESSFAINAIRLCVEVEALAGLRQLTWQLIDAVGSVASNHRAMRERDQRASSPRNCRS